MTDEASRHKLVWVSGKERDVRRARWVAAVAAGYVVAAVAGLVVLDQLLRRADRSDLAALDAEGATAVLAVSAIAGMGLIVIWRTQHVVGWWLLGIGVAGVTSGLAEAYASYGEIASPGALPASAAIAPLAEAAFWPVFACLAMILLLTPTGKPPTPRWRRLLPVIPAAAAAWVAISLLSDDPMEPPLDQVDNPLAIDAVQPLLIVGEPFAAVVTHGAVIVAGISLVRRFRRSTGVERQQLRWVAFSAIVAAAAVVVAFVAAVADQQVLLGVAALIVITAVPAGVTIGVSRFRLYDLDRVVSRSVVFALLTALVAAVYAVVVLVLGGLVGRGQLTSGVAAVAAALAVAPLRTRAQRTVDRLLFGRRSEPFTVVSGLNQRLQASTSPDEALRTLVETVADDLRLPYVAVESAAATTLAAAGAITAQGCERFPLTYQHEDVGTLVLGLRRGEDAFEPGERRLLVDLARHAGAVVRSAAVMSDLRSAQSRLVTAREKERRRLRRDLHDGLGPQLSAVTLKVDAARNHLLTDPAQADAVLRELRGDVKAAIDDIRRLVYALRPPGLDDLGLVGALQRHAQACTTPVGDLRITVNGDDVTGLPAPVEVAAYRIATEAMTNTVRHAHARRCDVNVHVDGDLVVEIVDDGAGLPERWQAGVGVTSMRERAVELGGSCTFDSNRATGTRVRARIPLTEGS